MDNNNYQPVFNPGTPPQAPQPIPQIPQSGQPLGQPVPQPAQGYAQQPGAIKAPTPKDAQAMIAAQSNRALIWTVISVISMIIAVTFIGLFIWMASQYDDSKKNIEGRIDAEVIQAKNQQALELETEFENREKSPYKMFTGPSDYGSLSFEYPKTWSLYEQRDSRAGGDYQAFINPDKVPPVDGENPIAVHVMILNVSFDEYISDYESDVEDGTMTLTIRPVGGTNANMYRGELDNEFIGIATVFKLRDKTVVIQTDANVFEEDYIRILDTVQFNS